MSFLISWLLGPSLQKPPKEQDIWTFDIEGSKLFINNELENVNASIWTFEIDDDELRIRQNSGEEKIYLKSYRDHLILKKLSKSICSLDEMKKTPSIKKPKAIPKPLESSDNPYNAPFWSKELKVENIWVKTYYFLNAEILAGRGYMSLNQEVALPGGSQVECNRQMIIDGTRWGNAEFSINQQACQLPKKTHAKEEICEDLIELLEQIYQVFQKNKELFQRFTSFFHQGPYNDMFYTIQEAVESNYGKILHQDQSKMRRSVHLYKNKGNSECLILAMDGIFRYAIMENGTSIKEAPENLDFGNFHGMAIINLKTQAAVVRLCAELSS